MSASLANSWHVVDLPAPGGPESQIILPFLSGCGVTCGQLKEKGIASRGEGFLVSKREKAQ